MSKKSSDDKKDKAKKRKLSPLVQDVISFWETSMEHDMTDTLGSYTGRPYEDEGFPDREYPSDDDIPEQDADDL